MANCLVAQSGGPTAVINASLAGVIRANQLNPVYDRVYGGLHGIEGVLDDKLYDLTDLPGSEIEILKQSPSSALGTCRYKLKRGNDTDFKRLVEIMDKHDIEVMFYIGGNDSMDTIGKLADYGQRVGSGIALRDEALEREHLLDRVGNAFRRGVDSPVGGGRGGDLLVDAHAVDIED